MPAAAPFRATSDLCDAHGDKVAVATPGLRHFGGRLRFFGPIATIRCFEDNVMVRTRLGEPGNGAVLVVDGGASLRTALVGDQLGLLSAGSGWAGIIVNGCVRDTAVLGTLDIGVLALASNPRRSVKRGQGERDAPVAFCGVEFRPGGWVYVDEDGLVVSPTQLD